MMHTLWNFRLLLVSPSIGSNRDHFLQADLWGLMRAITGHSVWSTAFIRSSFIRPPYTSIAERAVSILRRSAGVS
jgi:hypothetical protein